MAEERTQRRLAAILAADVVGYSRLMEADEAATLGALKAWQRDTLHPLVASHGGRVVKLMGDGVLAEFASAVNATQCAVALQAARVTGPDGPILLRVGINLGDVVVEGEDLYGDGVNLAARIEALAEPGAVFLSQAVFDQVQGKVDVAFEDTGEHSLKNIARPVRVYRAIGSQRRDESVSAASVQSVADPAPRPTAAVLPFVSMSADAEQRFLADGITEDIITELSRFTSLTVVARNSSFRYRDQPVDVKRIRRELGVRYVIEGSLRPLGDRIRITAQLIDAETGSHLWAERYDRAAADLAGAQDAVVRAIVTATAIRVAENEEELRRQRSPVAATAYDHVLQARQLMLDDYLVAEAPLRQAIALDPDMSEAHALLVYPLLHKYAYGDDAAPLQEAARSARRAIALNPRGSGPQFSMAVIASIQGNYELSGFHFDRAVALNPNNTVAQIGRAQWLLWGGRAEEALAALDLTSPSEGMAPTFHWEVRGEILYQLRRYQEALDAFGRLEAPLFWIEALVIASLAQAGRTEEARRKAAALHEAESNVTIARVLKVTCYKDEAMRDHFVEGMRKAGMAP